MWEVESIIGATNGLNWGGIEADTDGVVATGRFVCVWYFFLNGSSKENFLITWENRFPDRPNSDLLLAAIDRDPVGFRKGLDVS